MTDLLGLALQLDSTGFESGLQRVTRGLDYLSGNIQQVRANMNRLGVGLGAVGGFLTRLNPIIGAVSGALSVVAIGMSLFGQRTQETTESIKQQVTEVDQLVSRFRELDIRRGYGETDPRRTVGGTVDTLTKIRLSNNERFTVGDAAGLLGISSDQQIRQLLARSGLGEDAFSGRPDRIRLPTDRFGPPTGPQFFRYDVNEISRSQLVSAGELLLRERQAAAAAAARPQTAPVSFGDPLFGQGLGVLNTRDQQNLRDREDAVAAAKIVEDNTKRAEEAMARLNSQVDRFADTLGGAFIDAASGAGRVSDILRQLGLGFSRSLASAAFSSVGRSIFGSGPTQTQRNQDSGFDPAAFGQG